MQFLSWSELWLDDTETDSKLQFVMDGEQVVIKDAKGSFWTICDKFARATLLVSIASIYGCSFANRMYDSDPSMIDIWC